MTARALAAAFSYFTTIPLGRIAVHEAPAPATFGYLPLVGIVVGGLAGGAAYGMSRIAPHPLVVATAFGVSIALTGALHLDGFLDSCDALFAAVSPQKRIEILKDPHHGTFAIAAFAVLAVFWLAALGSVPASRLPATLAFAAGSARWAAVLNAFFFRYGGLPQRPPVIALALTLLALLALSVVVGPWAALALPAAAIFASLAGRWAATRLDGRLSGDVYGGLILVGEVGVLTACAGLLPR